MNQHYDIIIIGSGMGGLTSAVILAKEGYRVCVLEKNNQYGGCLQTFSRDKTIFDTGVHYIGSLGKGENLYNYFKYLGIMEELKIAPMNADAFDKISFGEEPIAYPIAQGYDKFVEELSRYFPDEKRALTDYSKRIQEICNTFALYDIVKIDADNEVGYNMEYFSQSVKEFLDSITDNEDLKCVLAGNNLLYAGNAYTTPIYVHALTVNSYIQSAWRCMLGGSQISKLLVKQLRKYNGEIFKRQEVKQFIYEGEKPIGVTTIDGVNYYAKQFISNIDLNATIKLVGEGHFRKSFTNRIKELELTPSSFSVYIKFKPESFPYLNYNIYHFRDKKSVWDASSCQGKWPEMYMLSMGPSLSNREYADNLSILTYMSFKEVEKWKETMNTIVNENDRGTEYQAFKEEKIEQIIAEIEKKFPRIRTHIQSVYASTPLSYRDYIGSKNGNMYGFAKDADNPLKTFVYPNSKISNLYLTGQSINMHGILGTTIGAVATCAEIIGRKKLIQRIQNEIKG